MTWVIEGLLDTSGFVGRWYCGRWTDLHGGLHIAADLAVFGAYAAIPVALVYIVRKRRDLPFTPLFWLFAVFIWACGVGHLVDATIFWQPHYRLLTSIKIVTAVASWLTVLALVRVLPRALAIQQSEQRFALAAQGSTDGVWHSNFETGETFFSDRFCELLGYAPRELEPNSKRWSELLHPEDRASVMGAYQAHLTERIPFDVETRMLMRGGATRWIRMRGQAVWNEEGVATRIAGSLTDITADKIVALGIDQLNADLELRVQERTAELSAMLREREVLIREVHHRVKHNLQVISSLINLQRRRLEGDAGQNALRECQARVLAIAHVHELLYRANDASRISLADYVESLVEGIDDMGGIGPRVRVEVDVDEVMLSVESGVPCGLILNELITNALKHGFASEKTGTICVRVRRILPFDLVLEVINDGQALPPSFDPVAHASLGLTIVSRLANQLKGKLEVDRDKGTCFRITFPAPDLVLREHANGPSIGALTEASTS